LSGCGKRKLVAYMKPMTAQQAAEAAKRQSGEIVIFSISARWEV